MESIKEYYSLILKRYFPNHYPQKDLNISNSLHQFMLIIFFSLKLK